MSCEPKHPSTAVSLTVLPSQAPASAHPHRPRSTMGWKRAAVLGSVQLLLIAHVVQWFVQGRTLSPLEPSETMATVKEGIVNAGAVLFVAALASTAVLGRWFCGWGCHVILLQDLCTWILGKAGIRPRPFRSRLLMFVPLLLAIYMFLWPLVYRFAIAPLVRPDVAPLRFTTEFIVDDFWRTFPGLLMSVPFLLVCGFLTVYLLGSKAYCTYGCPYGGLFAPLDEIAPGRIRVNDDCEQCGHCTAVCTSNVRVHEEVRDYGMVIDPGCMKCMDCVSACPNEALSFDFGRPATLRRARPAASPRERHYDLTLSEEVGIAIVAAIVFLSVRGSVGTSLPLLFASGVTACATFVVWKAWCTLTRENEHFHRRQLKQRGAITPSGYAWVAVAAATFGLAAYTAVLNAAGTLASWLEDRVTIPSEVVFSGHPMALEPWVARDAERALWIYSTASCVSAGGFAILPVPQDAIDMRRAWLLSALGRFGEAETLMRSVIARDGLAQHSAAALARILRGQGRETEAIAVYGEATSAHPEWRDLQEEFVLWLVSEGSVREALASARAALERRPDELLYMRRLSLILMEHGSLPEVEEGIALTNRTLEIAPDNPFAYRALAAGYFRLDRLAEAEEAMRTAVRLAPDNWRLKQALGELLIGVGKPEEGAPLLREARQRGVFGVE